MKLGNVIMRLIIYGALIAVLSNACTTINIINDKLSQLSYTDSALKPYSDRFIAEGSKRGQQWNTRKLTMVFGKTGTKDQPHVIGTCSFQNEFPIVIIDEQYWKFSDENEKEELVFHELGHCILNRDHCEIKDNGKATTIMEPEMLGSSYFKQNREKLIDELFKPERGCGQLSKSAHGVDVRIR